MNRSPPSTLQLGEGPELKGFSGAPVHRQDRDRGKERGAVNSSAALALVAQRPSCTTHCLKVWFSIMNPLRCPQTGSLETYVAVEWLICSGTGGIGPLYGIGPARLSVLYFKLLQLWEKMTLLAHDAELENQLISYLSLNSWHTQREIKPCFDHMPTSECYFFHKAENAVNFVRQQLPRKITFSFFMHSNLPTDFATWSTILQSIQSNKLLKLSKMRKTQQLQLSHVSKVENFGMHEIIPVPGLPL